MIAASTKGSLALAVLALAWCASGAEAGQPTWWRAHKPAHAIKGRAYASSQTNGLGVAIPYFQGSNSVSGGFAESYGADGLASEFGTASGGTMGQNIVTEADTNQDAEAYQITDRDGYAVPGGAAAVAGFNGAALDRDDKAFLVAMGSQNSKTKAYGRTNVARSVGAEEAGAAPDPRSLFINLAKLQRVTQSNFEEGLVPMAPEFSDDVFQG